MEGKIRDVLEGIGLNKNEIKVYLDLTKSGESSALDISKRTKIHRSNTYDVIRNLTSKGFVSELSSDGRRVFKAISPERIRDYINQKRQDFEEVLPDLKQLSGNEKSISSSWISEGIFAAREALDDLLKLEGPIMAFGASNAAVEGFGTSWLEDFHNRRIKKKVLMKHIYNSDAKGRMRLLNSLELTEARYIPGNSGEFDTVTATTICDNTVLIIIFGKPVLVITIINSDIAKTYKNYFNILWKGSRKPTNGS